MKTIFVVTTIQFGMKKLKVGPNKGKKILGIVDKRTIGWFPKLETAQNCVDRNWGDIYEAGQYSWAVVEEIVYGVYPPTNEWWYRWDSKKGKYRPSPKLKQYEKVTNFAMG